jgi:hypothetical protein
VIARLTVVDGDSGDGGGPGAPVGGVLNGMNALDDRLQCCVDFRVYAAVVGSGVGCEMTPPIACDVGAVSPFLLF